VIRMLLLLGLALALTLPENGMSQDRASLDQVESLIAQGRILQARQVLEAWWEDQGPRVNRMDRQRSLWLRARLTVDPSMAEPDLRRLVLEFPGGLYSDDALVRLAQAAELRGDLRGAHDHYSALVRGYPSSPHVVGAEAWLREKREEVSALGPETPSQTVESQGGVPSVAEGSFAVQAGAFRNLDGAQTLAEGLRSLGYDPRIVRVGDDGLFRVRLGRFLSREDAGDLLTGLARDGFEATIARDAESEERIR